MVRATVGATAAVRCEQAVERGDDGPFRRAGGQRERKVIERSVEVISGSQFLIRHPENSIGAIVRQRRARTGFKNELRRQNDARDPELVTAAVEQHRKLVTGLELIRLRERFAHEQFTAAAGFKPFPRSQKESVQLWLYEIGQGTHLSAGRLVQFRKVERHLNRNPRLHGRNTWNLCDATR